MNIFLDLNLQKNAKQRLVMFNVIDAQKLCIKIYWKSIKWKTIVLN